MRNRKLTVADEMKVSDEKKFIKFPIFSTMNPTFQQAARLNNEGVTALVEGNENEAISCFMMAVKTMKQLLAMPCSNIEALQSDDTNDGESSTSSSFEDFGTSEVSGSCCHSSCLFRQAIHLPCDEDDAHALNVYLYSAAVIFNLALAHHVQAHSGNTAYMTKAEKLYATILKLLDDRVGHMQPAVVLKLACINNMAYIRFENGNYDQVREDLSQLSNLLNTTDKVLFEGARAQGLLMSVLLLKGPRVAPAA